LLLTHRGETRTHVVTLSDPRHVRGRVSFRLRAVPRGVEAGHAHTHDLVAGRYGRAALFIDDAAYPPCPATVSVLGSCVITSGRWINVLWPSGTKLGQEVAISACGLSGADPFFGTWPFQSSQPTGVVDWRLAACPSTTQVGSLILTAVETGSVLYSNVRVYPSLDTPATALVTLSLPSTTSTGRSGDVGEVP